MANIVTSAVTSHPAMLQIALGLLAREKKTIQQLYAFGVSASYDEIRRYKISAAATTNFFDLSLDAEKGLIQGVTTMIQIYHLKMASNQHILWLRSLHNQYSMILKIEKPQFHGYKKVTLKVLNSILSKCKCTKERKYL